MIEHRSGMIEHGSGVIEHGSGMIEHKSGMIEHRSGVAVSHSFLSSVAARPTCVHDRLCIMSVSVLTAILQVDLG